MKMHLMGGNAYEVSVYRILNNIGRYLSLLMSDGALVLLLDTSHW